MLQQTQEFERQQANVQERLKIVTSSDTPEEATQRLRGPLEKLRKLQLAERYVDMLEYIESLKDNARGCLPQSPKEALKPYIHLKELAIQLQQLQEPAVSHHSVPREQSDCPTYKPVLLSCYIVYFPSALLLQTLLSNFGSYIVHCSNIVVKCLVHS
jgi:hypothetical protein